MVRAIPAARLTEVGKDRARRLAARVGDVDDPPAADLAQVQRLPHAFAEKVVWGSRYPHHDTTSAWDAIEALTQAAVEEPLMARMLGGNAAAQFGIALTRHVSE